ncbi:MAG: heme-binding protein [Nitrosomonas sp.]|nr:heme-binding protein [Nitrosomonas sp.]
MRRVILAMMMVIGPVSVQAKEELPRLAQLTQVQAFLAANAALAQCQKDGYNVAVAVVDRAGVVLAQLRDYRAGAHTIDSSRSKAYTSASLRESTQKLAVLVSGNSTIHALGQMNDSILLLGGGFPIKLHGDVVGGIGVGGAPGTSLDEKCARAGLAAIEADRFEQH